MSQNMRAGKIDLPWKILIADDDQDVHTATQLALRGVVFRGRPIEFINAYSAQETLSCLHQHPDTAVVLLDVIMESDDAGLSAVQQIRAQGFSLVRLILRTGHPGQAPEREVIVDYDIHDYKQKSGLTTQKLFSSLISALRAYDDLQALEAHRRGLLSVLESVSWFDFAAVQRYVDGMLVEFASLARLRTEQVVIAARFGGPGNSQIRVVASSGQWVLPQEPVQVLEGLPAEATAAILDSYALAQGLETQGGGTLYVANQGVEVVAYAEGAQALADADSVLLEVFLVKVCQAVANYRAFQMVSSERDALLLGLAEAAEQCHGGLAPEGMLARLSTAMAHRLDTTLSFPGQIDAELKQNIAVASGLHDLGNLLLPPGLLMQARALSDREQEGMREHVAAGLKLLKPSQEQAKDSAMLALAAQIISAHHEHYDGSGYPCGLRGEEIPLAARVVAVADAFTAMLSSRPHRPALNREEAVQAIVAASGTQFDPLVVEAFVQIMENDGAC